MAKTTQTQTDANGNLLVVTNEVIAFLLISLKRKKDRPNFGLTSYELRDDSYIYIATFLENEHVYNVEVTGINQEASGSLLVSWQNQLADVINQKTQAILNGASDLADELDARAVEIQNSITEIADDLVAKKLLRYAENFTINTGA